jgi:hypothetical protein
LTWIPLSDVGDEDGPTKIVPLSAGASVPYWPIPGDHDITNNPPGGMFAEEEESAGWADRVPATFGAVMEAMPTLTDEMGEAAAAALRLEAAPTLQPQPYRRRVIVHARRLER